MNKNDRIYANFRQAAGLLRDPNLVWSADLDCIREELAEFIDSQAGLGTKNSPWLIKVVDILLADENDVSVQWTMN